MERGIRPSVEKTEELEREEGRGEEWSERGRERTRKPLSKIESSCV